MNILKSFGLLVLGVIIGMITQCNKDKAMFANLKPVEIHDTTFIRINNTEFIPSDPVIVTRNIIKYRSIFKHDTTTVDVLRKEIVYRDRWNSDLLSDTDCKDSLKTSMGMIDTLLVQIAELQKLKIYKDTIENKEYTATVVIQGQNVKQTDIKIITNKNYKSFSVNPKAGLNFIDGKVINASVGVGLGYKNLTLDGLYTPQTKQVGTYLVYKLTFKKIKL